jgi:hypothetical protein
MMRAADERGQGSAGASARITPGRIGASDLAQVVQ